ncbi:putative Hemerythrin-like metal binding protein [Magnetofaba australis IT-1]|uniref:Hemerythrin-like metal binding protein n=1 Tax=Magnetofaba australis IT-1 TaxID=1434232 RepID=W0LJ27_9PROT|nr:hemerythrin-like metal binding protein [Magnetofaba australis IT-1]OSM08650.1 putative Hemerythrin-like metal binding protein [Magnetofaba australis IT-1]
MTWNQTAYSVGVEEFDAAHRKLLAVINLILLAESEGNLETAQMAANELLLYTKEHFQQEESWMRHQGYSALADHAKRHEEMTSEVLAFRIELRGQREEVLSRLKTHAPRFKKWLFDHIVRYDKMYASLATKGRD